MPNLRPLDPASARSVFDSAVAGCAAGVAAAPRRFGRVAVPELCDA